MDLGRFFGGPCRQITINVVVQRTKSNQKLKAYNIYIFIMAKQNTSSELKNIYVQYMYFFNKNIYDFHTQISIFFNQGYQYHLRKKSHVHPWSKMPLRPPLNLCDSFQCRLPLPAHPPSLGGTFASFSIILKSMNYQLI